MSNMKLTTQTSSDELPLTAAQIVQLETWQQSRNDLGEAPLDKNELLVYNACVNDLTAIKLAKASKSSWTAFRMHVRQMFVTGEWANVAIPQYDLLTSEIEGYVRFTDVDAWFKHIRLEANIDDQEASALRIAIEFIMPAAEEGLLGTTTPEDIASLPVSKLEAIAPLARSTKKRVEAAQDDDTAQEALDTFGAIVETAKNPEKSKRTLSNEIAQLSDNQNNKVICYSAWLQTDPPLKVFVIKPNSISEVKYIEMMLGNGLNLTQVTLDEIKSLVK